MGEGLTPIGDASKFGQSVVETVRDFSRPWNTRRQTRADCEHVAAMAKAEAEAKIVLAEADVRVAELLQDAKHRLVVTEIRRQQNIDAITVKALEYQPPKDQDAQCEPPPPDWTAWFMEGCQDVSDQSMQDWWSRLLAGQITKPGAYSRRAMTVLRDMDAEDSRVFEKVASLVWSRSNGVSLVMRPEANHLPLTDAEIFRLEACGVMKGRYSTRFAKDEILRAGLITYQVTEETGATAWLLTPAGSELCQLVTEHDEEYSSKVYHWINGPTTLIQVGH